ncbi:unnamed protein product, partial [Iphiclides podalirius]
MGRGARAQRNTTTHRPYPRARLDYNMPVTVRIGGAVRGGRLEEARAAAARRYGNASGGNGAELLSAEDNRPPPPVLSNPLPTPPTNPPLILTRIQSDKIRASYKRYAKRLHTTTQR